MIRPFPWPLILCGPILRIACATSVQVFVALSAPGRVKLRILDADGQDVASGSVQTKPLAKCLHPVVVTAQTSAGSELLPGVIYRYDIELVVEGQPPATLRSLDLLNEPSLLGYAKGQLPSFSLPPREVERVRILHGSCRKPHGEDFDMLALADDLIASTREDAYGRPHHLLLTGDQIYADDVALPLAQAISDVATRLVCGDQPREGALDFERVATSDGRTLTQWSDEVRAGAQREGLLGRFSGLTTSAKRGHLIFLAEFYAMYLLVLSDELWPRSPPPAPEPRIEFDAANLEGEMLESATDHELPRIRDFVSSLPKVRRLLANVPVGMIFDDHEVTDDWNITRGWTETVREHTVGRRVVRNALAAYAVFQHWGNATGDFADADSPGCRLLRLLEVDASAPQLTNGLSHEEGAADALLGLNWGRRGAAAPRLSFHWKQIFDEYQIIALDIRTRRAYRSRTSAAELIDAAALTEQLAAARRGLATIVISPTPVFGLRLAEMVQDRFLLVGAPEDLDAESWSADGGSMRRFVRALARLERIVVLCGDVHYGYSTQVEIRVRDDVDAFARIAHLCSSSLLNEDSKTRLASLGGLPHPALPIIGGVLADIDPANDLAPHGITPLASARELLLAAVSECRDSDLRRVLSAQLFGLCAAQRLDGHFTFRSDIWDDPRLRDVLDALGGSVRYRARFISDPRPLSERVPSGTEGDDPEEPGAVLRRMVSLLASDTVVGFANIGEVRFHVDVAGKPTSVTHRLRFRGLRSDARTQFFETLHHLSLEPPTATDF